VNDVTFYKAEMTIVERCQTALCRFWFDNSGDRLSWSEMMRAIFDER